MNIRQVYTPQFHRSLPNVNLNFIPCPEDPDDQIRCLVTLLENKCGVCVDPLQQPSEEANAAAKYMKEAHHTTEMQKLTQGNDEEECMQDTDKGNSDGSQSEADSTGRKSTLIFVNTSIAADVLCDQLQYYGVKGVVAFHRSFLTTISPLDKV